MKIRLYSAALILSLAGCQQESPKEAPHKAQTTTKQPTTEQPTTEKMKRQSARQTKPQTIAKDLDSPWQITRDGERFIITQRTGKLIEINGTNKKELKLTLKKPVLQQGESGLLGFVMHPRDNSKAFLYHTYDDNGPKNRVVLMKKTNDGFTEEKELLADINGGTIHNGGRIEISPDDFLFITVGDGGAEETAQDKDALSGKILRMTLNGDIPKNNPFDSYVYSYGHRNPQGITFTDGDIYAAEHGNNHHDEINKIEAGKNYGWPVIQGTEKHANMVTPIYETGEDTLAPSGIVARADDIYFATLRGESIQRFNIKSKKITPVITDKGRIRDVYIEDDTLYYITNNTDGRGTPKSGDDHFYSVPLKSLK